MTHHDGDPTEEPPALDRLQALARAHGVGVDFWGFYGDLHAVSAATLTRTLASLGVDAGTAKAVESAVADRENHAWRQLLPPTVVQRQGAAVQVPVHVNDGDPVRVWIVDEHDREWPTYQADVWVPPREVDGVMIGRATFWTPSELPLGWHVLRAESRGRQDEATLAVVPQRLTTADELPGRTGRSRTWGLMTQLYSVRSERSWGVGDVGDLADLAAIAGSEGADWVLVNPLHAAEPVPPVENSPYLPATRRFWNPLYIRVEAIPECAYLAAADRVRMDELAAESRTGNRDASQLRRDPAYARKLEALEMVYAVPRSPGRQALFERYKAQQGEGLEDFALWCAVRAERGADDPWWDSASLHSPTADAERERLQDRIDFACWLQWVVDQQLQAAQTTARECGMGLGIVHDLAVGVHWQGADAWTLRHVLAEGATVGAPADMYNQQGQNWSQPPWHPDRLAEVGYAPWRDMLRTILRHAGGVRVDHVLGLFRLWWVPEGLPASQGNYVYYDHEALIGILCLEAQRAGAVVVGEDLGTFEPWVREYLAARGLLGTSILWFENAPDHTPIPPEQYRRGCLASVNTHDLPPTAGYLAGEHIALRQRLGLLTRPVQEEVAADQAEKARVLGMCRERGLLGDDPTEQETVEALYRLLAAAPSLMHGVALVDAVGDRRIQNQPGTDEEYPNWRIPLADSEGRAVLVDDLPANERARSLFAAVRETLT
ncbi:MAG TPA: 4-alpha-glucanotransferase [Dermatophilaceae bacterium]|nr:4-alpha-glucanotransferase [Dermatophilaceae bacterium]